MKSAMPARCASIYRLLTLIALAPLAIAGCGGPGVATVKTSGKVTVAGQPMAGIVVTFSPADGRPATGSTDANGHFDLSTFSSSDGAVVGKHKVSFAMPGTESEEMPVPGAAGPPEPTAPFNPKYLSGDTSQITAEVVAGKANEFSWDLEK